jgi:hypothetical protein
LSDKTFCGAHGFGLLPVFVTLDPHETSRSVSAADAEDHLQG